MLYSLFVNYFPIYRDKMNSMKPEVHEKLWGREIWLVNNDLYCGKILVFKAGGKTSMHYHRIKDESMYLYSGKMLIKMEDETVPLDVGDTIHILPFQHHQLIAIEDSELIETSTTHFDSDSVRLYR